MIDCINALILFEAREAGYFLHRVVAASRSDHLRQVPPHIGLWHYK